MRNLILSVVFGAVALVGCGSNGMDAKIDGEEQSFDEVKVELTEDGSLYRLTANGSQEADGATKQLLFEMTMNAAAVKTAETGKELSVDGAATFAGQATVATYARKTTQDEAVAAVSLRLDCADCTRKGDEQQDISGKLTLDSVSDDTLSGTVTLTITGDIPNWSKEGVTSSTAELEVSFDTEISKPAAPAE